MKKANFYLLLISMALASPAMAEHGSLAGNQRDAWINAAVRNLVSEGWADQPTKPVADMTNLEVAQLTAKASEVLVAQASTAVAGGTGVTAKASPSLQKLVEEFKGELSNMDVDMAKLEDQIFAQQHRNEKFATLQKEFLKRTGTEAAGYSRAYFDTYRGLGANAAYSSLDYNDVIFGDLTLKSIPVPFVMFNTTLRLSRTIGLYYADPIQPSFNLRWLSLSNVNDVATLTAGDFYRNYTPLTLWNAEIPVYTMIEPTSYYRARKDVEELVYMDHGPQWHLRGFEGLSDQDLKNPIFSGFHLQAMAGELTSATQYSFANEYAGSEDAVDFLDNNVEIKGSGLLLWSDTGTANAPYIPNLISTYAKQYQVGSVSASFTLPIDKDKNFTITGSGEYAGSRYQDDSKNPNSVIQDSAILANGSINFQTYHLTLKFVDNGAFFYSPGAQTNRFTPATGTVGYIATNQNLDDSLPGYLNNYVFQGLNRPAFAPYDRMGENALPYGDASPNRQGFVLGASAEIGKDGWLKPQASYMLMMHELQANSVLDPSGVGMDSVDGSGIARAFEGFEGALTIDLAKALDGFLSTCSISGDFKHQTSALYLGANPFAVNTLIVSADAGPYPDIPLFEGLILTTAFEQVQSTGSEFTLSGAGNPPTLANYATYFDTGSIGSYLYQPLNITRTSFAVGFKLPLSKAFQIHGDWFYNQYQWTDVPGYDRRDENWRLTYEVSF